jgi:chemotaxis response regulator CheB
MAAVYMVYYNQLFRDVLRAILNTKPGIELVGATDHPERAEGEIASLSPSVVLLEDVADGSFNHDIHRLLTNSNPCRLITLRLDRDGMHVWSQTWRQSVSPDDLLEAIVTAGEDEA